jgi:hypothetical protein
MKTVGDGRRRRALWLLLAWWTGAGASGLSVDIDSRERSRTFFNAVHFASENVDPGWTGDAGACLAGDVSAESREAVRLRVNLYRAYAGLPADIAFAEEYNRKAQQAALMMSANGSLSHFPPASWKCYGPEGAEAAGKANLSLGYFGPAAVDGQMRDAEDKNEAVGHRRWLLYPQTRTMGTGDIPGQGAFKSANGIWVQDGNYGTARPATREEFTAWPPPGYVPRPLAFSRWSFSYPDADFSNARVAMTLDGDPLTIRIDSDNAKGLGENALTWTPSGALPERLERDAVYQVAIDGTAVKGVSRSFAYRVTVFDPSVYGPDTAFPAVSGPDRPTVGAENLYKLTPQPGADGHEWLQAAARPLSYAEGAETGLDGLIVQVTDPAQLITQAAHHAGAASFHLTHGQPVAQYLELDKNLLAGASAELRFFSRLGFATDTEIASAQISADGGHSWFTVYEQAGAEGTRETAFAQRRIDLSAYAGRILRIRFAYAIRPKTDSYTYYSDGEAEGWNIDDIVPADFLALENALVQAAPASGELAFAPNAQGDYALAARGLVQGHYPSEWGASKIVSAATGAGETFSLSLAKRGAGLGEIRDAAAGLACDDACSGLVQALPAGTVLKLTATAATGSVFAGWNGACTGTGVCALTLDRDKSVGAVFDKAPAAEFSLQFEERTDAPPKAFVYSNAATVENLPSPQKLSIAGGAYSLNGGAYTNKPGKVFNGDALTIRVKSAQRPGAAKTATIRIGRAVVAFKVTTML